ncbi:MAG: hypothetical protein J0H87_00955 [Holosporales bacterium]|nr:hypothetical protein [Holosporales bacterium]
MKLKFLSLVILLIPFWGTIVKSSENKLEYISLISNENDLIEKYRMIAPNTWLKEALIFLPLPFFDDHDKKRYKIELDLHHLAGNASHIVRMHNNESYLSIVRLREEDYGYDDFIGKSVTKDRNSIEDLKKIIHIFRTYDHSSILEKVGMYTAIMAARIEMEAYRTQRKLRTFPDDDYDIDYD